MSADELSAARAAQHREMSFHLALLLLSGTVLLLSALLAVRGSTRVMVPRWNFTVPELCMSRRLLGIACPGCGLTRSFISLAHGDVAAAWSYNPAGLVLFAMLAFQVPYRGLQLWRIRRGKSELSFHLAAHVTLWSFAILLIGQWLLRMI
jgi:hypothetical protein